MRKLGLSAVAVCAMGLLGPSSGLATVTVGETIDPTGSNCSNTLFALQTTSPTNQYVVPSPGILTSWSFLASANAPTIKFKVARPTGNADEFFIVGESALKQTVQGPNTFTDISIPVQAGDVIGFYTESGGDCGQLSMTHTVNYRGGDAGAGATITAANSSALHLDISATLEGDCDSDGFGDETEDPDIASCTPPPDATTPDTTAPDTTITKYPKAKTKKKAATFEFTGTDARAVASFECSLNGAPFASCTSPLTVKGKKGKNHLEVRAKDAAGNVDATPATFDWKVKKKKKKK
jgi:hypothetical protein